MSGAVVGALIQATLRADAVEEYDRLHTRVPDEVVEAIRSAGIEDWSIWREGRTLFQLVIASSWDQIESVMTHQPEGWQLHMASLVDPDAPPVPLRRVDVSWLLRKSHE